MPKSSASGASSSSTKSATKRLLKELEKWGHEQKDESGIERLGPVDDANLLEWQAVINGKGVGSGYDGGRTPSPFANHKQSVF
jgi:peroxin-4